MIFVPLTRAVCFELNVVQSVLDNLPVFVALAVGMFTVKVPAVVTVPVAFTLVPEVPVAIETLVTVPEPPPPPEADGRDDDPDAGR